MATTTTDAPPDLTDTITLISQFPVASGGFSDVYKGALSDGQTVAVKVVRVSATEVIEMCCKRETKFWHNLRHRHILKFLGTCVLFNRPGLVSLWLDNGTALDFIRKYPTADRMKILRQAGSALEYLHKRGVTHGDIKCANILVDNAENAFLTDFGLARMREAMGNATPTPSLLRNAGSTRFMAPELHEEDIVGGHFSHIEADVYAFGCTILELMTGQHPFAEIPRDATVVFRVSQGYRPRRPPSFDGRLWSLCEACWEHDPRARPTMQQVLTLLVAPEDNLQALLDLVATLESRLSDSERLMWQARFQAETNAKERDAIAKERDVYAKERDVLAKERDTLAKERDALAKARDAFAKERDTLAEERLTFVHEINALRRKLKETELEVADQETGIKANVGLRIAEIANRAKEEHMLDLEAVTHESRRVAGDPEKMAMWDAEQKRLKGEVDKLEKEQEQLHLLSPGSFDKAEIERKASRRLLDRFRSKA